ncbi:MAG: Wzy polymerase domain-containing protein [Methylomonas sp.]
MKATNAASDKFQNWLMYGLGILVWVPFTYYRGTDPVTTFFGEWLAFLVGLIVIASFLFFLKQNTLKIPSIAVLPTGIAALIAIQIVFFKSIVLAYAEVGILYLLWAAFIMVAAAHVSEKIGFFKLADCVAWFFLAGGIWNVLSELNHIENLRLFGRNFPELLGLGTIGQSNQICDYLFMSCCSLLYLFTRNLLGWRVFFSCLLLLTAELGLSSSRSGLLYLIAGGVMVWWWRHLEDQQGFKRLRDGYLIFALLYISWQFLYPLLGYTTGATRLAANASDVYTPSQRLFFWKDAWDIFLQSPWLGAGFGEFDWAFFMHGQNHDHSFINNRIEHAHNLLFQLLAEMGIAGVLWFMVIGILWFRNIVKRERNISDWWCLTLLSILGIHSLLEYPLWLSNFLGIFAVLLGASDSRQFELKLSKITRFALCLIPIFGLFLLVNTGLGYLKLEKFYTAVAESLPTPGKFEEIVPISNSGLLAPFGLKYFAFVFKFDSAQAAEKASITEKALHFEPIPPLAYKQAVYLAYLGKQDEARALLQLAMSSYPNELNWFLSQVNMLNQADKDKLAFLFSDGIVKRL